MSGVPDLRDLYRRPVIVAPMGILGRFAAGTTF